MQAGARLPIAFAALLVSGILMQRAWATLQKGLAAAGGGGGAPSGTGGSFNDPKLGPVTNPVPGATMSRLDQGFDGTGQKFVSPFNGTVVLADQSNGGWAGGGMVAIKNALDPSKVFYLAEGLSPTVHVGQQVSVGQPVANPRPNPYNGISGNFEIGWANPAAPSQPLAQVIGNARQMVLDMYNWLRKLGAGPATDTSAAGHA